MELSQFRERSRMKGILKKIGLTPYGTIFLHLFLTGIPLRFGLLLTGWGRGWLIPEKYLDNGCSIFRKMQCSSVEQFAVQDAGVRFIIQFELACVVWFVMRTNAVIAVAFHKVLVASSICTLFVLIWLQNYFHRDVSQPAFDRKFFKSTLLLYLFAIIVSILMILSYPKTMTESMKWSIPANAIFCGAVINIFIALASFQALADGLGIARYYTEDVTAVVHVCFILSALFTAQHALLLFRIRTFLSVKQLRTICLYKVIVNVVLPFFWFPDLNPGMLIDRNLTIAIRVALTLIYTLGYLCAGKAEGFSRILTSEKDE